MRFARGMSTGTRPLKMTRVSLLVMGNLSPAEGAQVKVKLHVVAERVDFTLQEMQLQIQGTI